MKKYVVKIPLHGYRTVLVEAETAREAEQKARVSEWDIEVDCYVYRAGEPKARIDYPEARG